MRDRWWKHIAIWALLYLLWVTAFQHRSLAFSRTLTVEFCYLLFIAGNYYFHTYFTIPKLFYRKKYLAFGVCLLGAVVISALLRTWLALYMNEHFFLPGKAQPAFTVVYFNSLLNIAVWVVFVIAMRLILEKRRFQQTIDLLQKEKTRNELDFLKAQFNPHFLFNSINSIYGHIDKNNPTARNMLLTFSEMLRYQLYECNTDIIPIDKEIHYIRNYTALQQIRKEEDLVVYLSISPEVKGFTIAPLLFIAFIENAFKYVSNDGSGANRVEISLDKRDGVLLFDLFNTKEKDVRREPEHQGIGISNVKRRLELLYPGRHDLVIDQQDHSYRVHLKIQVS